MKTIFIYDYSVMLVVKNQNLRYRERRSGCYFWSTHSHDRGTTMRSSRKSKTKGSTGHRRAENYSAPALDKGLDILELVAEQKGGLTQSQIASALDRSINEIYRMLNCLERRGYLYRSRPGDLYFLSMKTFEVAHRQAPLRGLLEIALPEMQRLADNTQQSCNLGTQSAGRVLVIAQVESPAPFGFMVRPGALFPMLPNAAGRVLLAYQPEGVQRSWLNAADGVPGATKKEAIFETLGSIRRQGYAEVRDETFNGITLSYPIIGSYGHAVAALTVPYISSISFGSRPVAEIRASLKATAASISSRLSGTDIRFDQSAL